MKFIGMWWNPNKDGEGFIFAQEGDRIIGYYYTYIGVDPTWFMLDLRREDDTVISGDVLVTRAKIDSEPGDPGKITEERVGGCTISSRGDDTWNISITLGAQSIDYVIGSLFGTGLPQWDPQPGQEPEPDPPVEEPPEEDPVPKAVRWDKWSDTLGDWVGRDIGGSHGSSNPNELYGSSPVDIDDINPRDKVGHYRLTVLEGQVRIVNPGGSGPYNPVVEGIDNGQVLDARDQATVTLWLGPGDPPPAGQWVHSNFIIDAYISNITEKVRIMTVSSQVADRAE